MNLILKEVPAEFAEKGFVRDLVWGVVRRLNTLDFIINGYSKTVELPVRNVIRLGIYQLLYEYSVPDYAAVNESVNLASRIKKPKAAGLINAVLRGVIRDREKLFDRINNASLAKRVAVAESHPEWLVSRWLKRWGEEGTIAACRANNLPPRLVIRVNAEAISREGLQEVFINEKLSFELSRYSPDGINFLANPQIEKLESYQSGLFVVQDEGSQLISMIMAPQPGEKILDLCCGSGIKTSHMAQLGQNKALITAVDTSSARIENAKENFKRLQLENVTFIEHDAATLKSGIWDKVLVDAPCSGFGAISRKPDIKWNRTSQDIAGKYPKQQSRILANASKLVRIGGSVVYCTCTTEPEENENVVESFLKKHANFIQEEITLPGENAGELLSDDKKYFRTSLLKNNTDGFFAVKLKRVS